MRRRLGSQRGISFGVVMIVIALIVLFANVAVTMLPSYFTFLQVRSAMASLHEKPDVVEAGPRSMLNSLAMQLSINNVRSVSTRDFKVEKTSKGLQLNVAYEVRKHLFFNIDVIMSFAHSELFQPT
jgi:hypothetical protein